MKAVVFDMDGTIVDTLSLYITAYDLTYKHFGFNLTREEIIKNFPIKLIDQCKNWGIPDKVNEVKKIYLENIYKVFTKVKLFNGFIKLINFIRSKKIKTAIVSFAFSDYVEFIVNKFSLKNYFDLIISFNDVKKAKPDPEAVYQVAKKFNVLPTDILVIGDAESDILMGKAAGSKTCLFYPKENREIYSEEKIKNISFDYLVKSLKEIEKFF